MTQPEQPEQPTAQRIALVIQAGQVQFQPGMDPDNPMYLLNIEFGPLAQQIQLPESNVEPFIAGVTNALRQQVEQGRASRLGAQQRRLLLADGYNLGALGGLADPAHAADVASLLNGMGGPGQPAPMIDPSRILRQP